MTSDLLVARAVPGCGPPHPSEVAAVDHVLVGGT